MRILAKQICHILLIEAIILWIRTVSAAHDRQANTGILFEIEFYE